jgi:hypothetical protein
VEKISWTDRERNEVCRVKEERNIVSTIKRRNDEWLHHMLCNHVTAEKI